MKSYLMYNAVGVLGASALDDLVKEVTTCIYYLNILYITLKYYINNSKKCIFF